MPLMPSGRYLGIKVDFDFPAILHKLRRRLLYRAEIASWEFPEQLYKSTRLGERPADGDAFLLGYTVQDLIEGRGDLSDADRHYFLDWLNHPSAIAIFNEALETRDRALVEHRAEAHPDDIGDDTQAIANEQANILVEIAAGYLRAQHRKERPPTSIIVPTEDC